MWVPQHRALTAILGSTSQCGVYMITNRRSQPYTGAGFRTNLQRLLRRLEAEGAVQMGLTFHRLRVTPATNLADAGGDDRMIAAVTGHRSSAMVRTYTEGADRRRRARAAITCLEKHDGGNG